MIYSRINITPSTIPIITILNDVRNVRQNGLDLSPDYQRGYIWTNDYKDKLILSIILNYPIGSIVVNHLDGPNENNAMQELVDGKQRLTTILKFVDGGQAPEGILDDGDTWFRLSPKVSQEVKETVKNILGSELSTAEELEVNKMQKAKKIAFKDLPTRIQNNITAYSLPIYTMTSASSEQIREYFKVLQNQEKLRAGEIINALPDNPLVPYFEEVGYDFLAAINYQSLKRSEFEKTYYAVVGLWFEKILINSEDRRIIEFVEQLSGLTSAQVEEVNRMNQNLKAVKDLGDQVLKHRMSKRTLKLLLGVAISCDKYFLTNTLSKVDYITRLSSKLAAFNSSESDEVSFAKYFSDEYTSNPEYFKLKIAPRYRELYTATARSTSKDTFCKAISTLIELCDEHVASSGILQS